MLKKRPRGKKKKKPSIKPPVGPTPTSIGSADGCFFISPPNSSHFLGRIGLVVFWLWKGNHRTAGAWIFQMTNVAHAYFWHIWLPQGNKTLLMQGDHLLSVAGVSEQADSVLALVRARTHTHIKDTHRQYRYTRRNAGRQIDMFSRSGRCVVRSRYDTCAHTRTNSRIRREHAQQTRSKLLYKLNTPFLPPFFFYSVCLSNAL